MTSYAENVSIWWRHHDPSWIKQLLAIWHTLPLQEIISRILKWGLCIHRVILSTYGDLQQFWKRACLSYNNIRSTACNSNSLHGKAPTIQLSLTHLPTGQNGLPLRRLHFQTHFHEWKVLNFDSGFTEVSSHGLIQNKSALFEVMAWRQTGYKSLPGPRHTWFIEAYVWHSEGMKQFCHTFLGEDCFLSWESFFLHGLITVCINNHISSKCRLNHWSLEMDE